MLGASAASRYATFSVGTNAESLDEPPQFKTRPKDEIHEKRTEVAMQILSSEQEFVKSLGQCVTTYLSVLKRSRSDLMTTENYTCLFGNFEDVYRHNRRFLHQLEDKMKDWNPETIIGTVFQSFWEGYTTQIYSQYINGFEDSLLLCERLQMENASFKSFLASARKVSEMDLKGYLQLPLKRLVIFTNMLEKLSSLTPPDHPDAENLKLATKDAKASVDEINLLKKKFDGQRKLKSLAEKFENVPQGVTIVEPTRYVIKEGRVLSYGGLKNHDYDLILCSDLVIIASFKKDKLKVSKLAPLAEVPMPQPTKVAKSQSNGFTLEICGVTLTLVPEGDCENWITTFRSAKETQP